ncbi:MAG TPA: DUF116 domain-containing protein [Methylomirabilota bacterium]|nr:DUF116 domain-containing protein [Methylomirabilota bacterium]
MPYQFDFDLTKVSRSFFREVAEAAHRRRLHRRIGDAAVHLLERCKIQEITGLDFAQALTLLEDFIDIQMKNVRDRERFLKTSKRVLLLPHCSRKFMDNRCKAVFDPKTPSYSCSHCSPDCLVNQATTAGEAKNYDVYVLPGGSCIHRILERGGYEALVGVACGEEIRLADGLLDRTGLPGQNVPLIKNGCANTTFSVDVLQKIL